MPVFVGNFEYETRQSELERLFSKYGRIELVDMKSGTSSKGHLQIASSCIFFSPSCYSPSSLAGGDPSNYHVMPTTTDYRRSLNSVMPCLLFRTPTISMAKHALQ